MNAFGKKVSQKHLIEYTSGMFECYLPIQPLVGLEDTTQSRPRKNRLRSDFGTDYSNCFLENQNQAPKFDTYYLTPLSYKFAKFVLRRFQKTNDNTSI